jgi:sugar/nucleoside kinase (ribokinase family)
MKVIGFGDNIVDRFLDRGVIYPGGNSLNFAVMARHLGVESAYMGVFGSDPLGAFVRSAVEAEGVDVSRCQTRQGPNGVTDIKVIDGDRIFLGWNEGGVTISQPFVLEPEHRDHLTAAALVHTSVYSASEDQLPALRAAGPLVSFDYSWEPERRTDQYLRRTAPFVDLALLSLGNAPFEAVAQELARATAAGASLAVATRGAAGAVLYDGEQLFTQVAAPTDVHRFVDTMGCGDAFVTGLSVSLLRSGWARDAPPTADSLRRALAFAAETAAEQCYVEGAFGHGHRFAAATRI